MLNGGRRTAPARPDPTTVARRGGRSPSPERTAANRVRSPAVRTAARPKASAVRERSPPREASPQPQERRERSPSPSERSVQDSRANGSTRPSPKARASQPQPAQQQVAQPAAAVVAMDGARSKFGDKAGTTLLKQWQRCSAAVEEAQRLTDELRKYAACDQLTLRPGAVFDPCAPNPGPELVIRVMAVPAQRARSAVRQTAPTPRKPSCVAMWTVDMLTERLVALRGTWSVVQSRDTPWDPSRDVDPWRIDSSASEVAVDMNTTRAKRESMSTLQLRDKMAELEAIRAAELRTLQSVQHDQLLLQQRLAEVEKDAQAWRGRFEQAQMDWMADEKQWQKELDAVKKEAELWRGKWCQQFTNLEGEVRAGRIVDSMKILPERGESKVSRPAWASQPTVSLKWDGGNDAAVEGAPVAENGEPDNIALIDSLLTAIKDARRGNKEVLQQARAVVNDTMRSQRDQELSATLQAVASNARGFFSEG
mmetsp:Transcript_84882/g.226940  ORF Transcript_84882/g.226940 Transcript_84882/m.226940 type:complete len:481 (+) Transcript_84882:33-1475(+)